VLQYFFTLFRELNTPFFFFFWKDTDEGASGTEEKVASTGAGDGAHGLLVRFRFLLHYFQAYPIW
jgi:hypothetical protein